MAWGELRQPRVFPGVWSFGAKGPPFAENCPRWRLMSLIQPTNNKIPHRTFNLWYLFKLSECPPPAAIFRIQELPSNCSANLTCSAEMLDFSRFQQQFGHFKLKDVVKTKMLTLIVTTINCQYDPWHFTMSQIINHYYHPMEIIATV